jgi:uncharacterized protein YegJ (DUF2314 family)
VNERSDSAVFVFHDDPEMQNAAEQARSTIRYFWRETAWEMRRIVPALSVAALKVSFSDPLPDRSGQGKSNPEHMWVSDVQFDGQFITGTLINSPNWLTSIKEGDTVRVPPARVCDWLYALDDRAYGGFTVNLLRSRMSDEERAGHDSCWGLEFGDPAHVELFPTEWFTVGSTAGHTEPVDHPMAVPMSEQLVEYLEANPSQVNQQDDAGWTLLHSQILAGSPACVSLLLDHGADRNLPMPNGMTPLDLATELGWSELCHLLTNYAI